jgi:hypothetical protein
MVRVTRGKGSVAWRVSEYLVEIVTVCHRTWFSSLHHQAVLMGANEYKKLANIRACGVVQPESTAQQDISGAHHRLMRIDALLIP